MKRKKPQFIMSLQIKNKIETHWTVVASAIDRFFSEVVPNLNKHVPVFLTPIKTFMKNPNLNLFFLLPSTLDKIEKNN